MLDPKDYQELWVTLEKAVDILLHLPPDAFPPVSYEETYSACYKCVCYGYSAQIHESLLAQIERYLAQTGANLKIELENKENLEFLKGFNDCWIQFKSSMAGVVPIFNYLNRFYVERDLKTSIRKEVFEMFESYLVKENLSRLLRSLSTCPSSLGPVKCPPSLVASTVYCLHTLNSSYADQYPDLFRPHIPTMFGVNNAGCFDNLHIVPDSLELEAREMLERARAACAEASGCTASGMSDERALDIAGGSGDCDMMEGISFGKDTAHESAKKRPHEMTEDGDSDQFSEERGKVRSVDSNEMQLFMERQRLLRKFRERKGVSSEIALPLDLVKRGC